MTILMRRVCRDDNDRTKKRILYSLVSISASNYQLHTPSFFYTRRTCPGPAFWRLLFHRIRCTIPHVFLCPFSGRFGLVCGKFFGHKCSAVLHLGSVAALMGLGLLHFGSRGSGVRCYFDFIWADDHFDGSAWLGDLGCTIQ